MSLYTLFAQTQNLYSTNMPSSKTSSSTSTSYLDGFFQHLTTGAAILFIVGFTLFILAIVFFIRWWMVQIAIFEMREDIRDIRNRIMESKASQNETQKYKEIIEDENSSEDKNSTTNDEHVIDSLAQSTNMIIEKAKSVKLPKWLFVVGIIIVISLVSLNGYFLLLK